MLGERRCQNDSGNDADVRSGADKEASALDKFYHAGHGIPWSSVKSSMIKGTLPGTPNREPQEYSRNIMEYKDPGWYLPIIYLLYSWGSLFGVPSRVPLMIGGMRILGGFSLGAYCRHPGSFVMKGANISSPLSRSKWGIWISYNIPRAIFIFYLFKGTVNPI